MMTRRSSNPRVAAVAAALVVLTLCLATRDAQAQPCGAGVSSPQCDGECALGQMCADLGSGCTCVPAVAACGNPTNPNGPPVCWGACPSTSMVCATFAGGCMCLQGPNLCGNGVLDPGEGCEDGNTVSGDGCDANCQPTGCGNGIATSGEECDGADAAACAAGCRPDCTCAAGPPTSAEVRCFLAISKAAEKFVQAKLKLLQSCEAQELGAPGSCPMPDPAAVTKLEQKLAAGLAKQCNLTPSAFDQMGFPGRCLNTVPPGGFTTADLLQCIRDSHAAALDALLAIELDSTVTGPLTDPSQIRCQSALGKAGVEVLLGTLKTVQKCRNAILKGNLVGVPPASCATLDPKTSTTIAKITAKAASLITAACDDGTTAALKVCTPDQTTAAGAATCMVVTHVEAVDDPDVTHPPDMLDYEYATAPVCGDHVVNQAVEECDGPDDGGCPGSCSAACTCPAPLCGNGVVDQAREECDGVDDAACPGNCGAASGFFACLCQDRARQRVVKHANADLDAGWSGAGHDAGAVEGAGYVTDLWDCDGPGGPDTLCAVGPSCSLAPHSPCADDAQCGSLAQGICRKTAGGATGPHCDLDVQQTCTSDLDCPASGDRCVFTPSGPPLPMASGNVALCITGAFTEDVIGTTDLATGASSVRERQRWTSNVATDPSQPCPVCGGFCAGTTTAGGPGTRTRCMTDADCPNPPNHCVLASVCSFGPNADEPCRPNPPFGGPTALFGNPSVDCPPPAASIAQADVLLNPVTTGATTLTANQHCTAAGSTGKTCVGGPNNGRPCTTAGDCPGATCNEQCFCPDAGGVPERPNACASACVGGSSDAQPCVIDGDCSGGFCHPGDCRVNPTDTDSVQEGVCTVGPTTSRCSLTTYRQCSGAVDCQPPACPECQPGETCSVQSSECFVNGLIVRSGVPNVPSKTTAAVFCLQATTSSAVNGAFGLPGPAAITQPATTMEVGF